MGFELNKLMRQYGLATPTMLSYEGERGPDVEVIDEETGEVTTTPGEITFDPAKQRAFDQYQAQYQSRLRNAPMYAGSQFQTQTTPQPMSYMQMYQQYLGRDPTDAERTDAIALDANITQENPLSLAQRQQFLRRYEDEFKDLGIRNTGNQAVMDTIGNYYGNILRNPDYRATPIDRSLPFEQRNPNIPNPNPRYTGPVISVDDAYANAVNVVSEPYESSDVIQGYLAANQDVADHAERTALAMGLTPGTTEYTRVIENTARTHFNEFGKDNAARLVEGFPETGRALMLDISQNLAPPPTYETSQTFLDFADQQDKILANLANPLPDESINTLEDARNVDPFAESSTGGPAYGAYLAKNLDVLDNITGFRSGTPQPGYAALNIPEGGFAPGTPENAAVQQYLANAAKEHFENFGFQEGRQFYKTGGPVKGYQVGGQPIDPYAAVETVNVDTQIDPYGVVDPLGLNVMIEQQTGLTEGDGPSVTAPQMQDNTNALENLLVEMTTKQVNPYKGIMDNLTGKIGEAQTVYDQQLEQLLANTRKGPDKAELYFNLAAALSAPTKTGTFGESLGLAAKQFGKFAADSRKMKQSADAAVLKKAEAKLKSLQSRFNKIEDKASEEAIRNQEQQFKIIKTLGDFGYKGEELKLKAENIQIKKEQMRLDKLKPKSKFGKIASDKGLIPGTQAYLLDIEKQQRLEAEQNNEMPSWLGKSLEEKVAAGNVARYSLGQLREALRLNENAYANDLFGLTISELKSLFGSDSVKVTNTRVLRNILSSEALQKLKATFGGKISDGERQALADLSGVTARSKEERKRIINKAIEVLDRLSHNSQKEIEWFGSPERFRAPFEGYAQYQLENFRFADDDVRRPR